MLVRSEDFYLDECIEILGILRTRKGDLIDVPLLDGCERSFYDMFLFLD